MSDIFTPGAFGWAEDPAEVALVLSAMQAAGDDPIFATAAAELLAGDDDAAVFFWEAEQKVVGRVLPSWNQGQVGSCFPAGTRIRLADGTHKPIETIRLNDEVLTAEGNKGRVRHLFVKTENEKLIRIRCCGHYGIAATAEHPVLTDRGYVRMDELRIGDSVAIPRYLPQTTKHVATDAHRTWTTRLRKDIAVGRLKTFNGAVQFGRKAAVVQIAPMPDVIELTPGFGRIIGLFLAEGSTDKNKVVWTFSQDEKDTLAADLVRLLASELGAEAHVQERGKSHVCRVNLHGRVWCELFESLCGNGAGLKRLHADIASGPLEFMKAVYDGWMDGDGHEADRHVQGTTVSHDLALAMFDIANAIGLRPVVRHYDPKISHGVRHRQRRYDVVVSSGDGKVEGGYGRDKAVQDEKHVWRKVTSITEEPFCGDVFNFEVEGDNSYVAEGIGVHNCVSFGYGRGCQDLMFLEIANGEAEQWPGKEVATEPIYGGSRVEVGGGRIGGDGSVGAWAAKWVHDWGVVLRDKYGSYDLTAYSESRCRDYGRSGVPDIIEQQARQHPVTAVAQLKTGEELWAAIGGWKPVPVCSNRGFTTTLKDGFCEPSGQWAHCMEFRGRFTHPSRGKSFVIQNSWGGYLKGDRFIEDIKRGRVELPEGCFACTFAVAASMIAADDSFALAGFSGWKRERIDYTP